MKINEGFKSFFIDKLKDVDYYSSKDEMKSDVNFAIENMSYDMESNRMSLMSAFNNACRDLYIDSDGIETYL